MKQLISSSKLPTFTKYEQSILRGSSDFFAVNHYTSYWVWDCSSKRFNGHKFKDTWVTDRKTCSSAINPYNKSVIGAKSNSDWLYSVPRGMYDILQLIQRKYINKIDNANKDNHLIYVTENGVTEPGEDEYTFVFNDTFRIKYISDYLNNIMKAKRDGINVNGYFVWSLMDNFEWAHGYNKRFGLYFVDYNDENLKRIPKKSALWFKQYVEQYRSTLN